MRQITITQALVELKLYDSKIVKSLAQSKFVDASKTRSDKIGSVAKEKFINDAKASYQSINDLIKNRAIIKSKIAESNANTFVIIDDKKMSVAEAIERKNSIEYDKMLLQEMKKQYNDATELVTRKNNEVDSQINKMLEIMAGRDNELTPEEQESTEITFRKNNEYSLIDPINISNKITEIEANIDGFLSNVDIVLSVSNAITFIECE